jgi:Cdc6-like AAA superfamily ATPase
MKFAVLKTSNNIIKKEIVTFVDSHDDFINYIKFNVPDNTMTLNDVSISDIETDNKYQNNKYLLINNDGCQLVQKDTIVESGWFYDNYNVVVTLSCSWTLTLIKEKEKEKETSLIVKQFNDDMMIDANNICIVGKRGTGKSFLIYNILDSYDETTIGNSLIVAPADRHTKMYATRYPTAKIIYDFDINNIYNHFIKNDADGNNIPGIIVLDQCIVSNTVIKNNDKLLDMFLYADDYDKTMITSLQFPVSMPENVINNLDYVFLFNDDYISNQKRMHKNYGQIFEKYKDFQKVYQDITNSLGTTLVMKIKGIEQSVDKMFYYKINSTYDRLSGEPDESDDLSIDNNYINNINVPNVLSNSINYNNINTKLINRSNIKSINRYDQISTIKQNTISTTKQDTAVPFQTFNLDNMVINPSIMIIGKSGTGKSTIVTNILDGLDETVLDNSLIISQFNNFYSDRYPNIDIKHKYSSELIEGFLKNKNPGVIVLDDCLQQLFCKDQGLRELLFNGRHYHKTVVMTSQNSLILQPDLRANCDYVFLLSESFPKYQRKLYDYYAGPFPSFETFKDTFSHMTRDFGAMVITNRGVGMNILDKIHRFKAQYNVVNKIEESDDETKPIRCFIEYANRFMCNRIEHSDSFSDEFE